MADCGYDLQLDVALVDKINISKNISNKKKTKIPLAMLCLCHL